MRAFLRWLHLFFVGDPYPQTDETIARARAAAAEELRAHYHQLDETPCYRGLSAIMAASQEPRVINLAERKKALLAKSLTEECGQLTGPAFTFERKEK